MDQPLVSVGMPVYNGEKSICRALDSLLKQDYPNVEIIVSDNASDDATQVICSKYKTGNKNISVIRQDRNIGILDNFKAVLSKAKGKYFMWAAADDSWHESFISQLATKLESDDHVAVAQSATMQISEADSRIIGYIRFDGKKNLENCSHLQLTKKIVSPLKYNYYIYGIFRRELLVEAYKYSPSIPSSDRWFLLQFPLAGYKFAYVDEPFYIRSIAEKPLYQRYENEAYACRVEAQEKKWFWFGSIPVVKKMLEESTMTNRVSNVKIVIVLLQIFQSRVLIGFNIMTNHYLTNLVKPLMIKLLPGVIAFSIINRWRSHVRKKNKHNQG